jgi:hypothetical protein
MNSPDFSSLTTPEQIRPLAQGVLYRTQEYGTSVGPRYVEFTRAGLTDPLARTRLRFHNVDYGLDCLCPDFGAEIVGHLLAPDLRLIGSLGLIGLNTARVLIDGIEIDTIVIRQIQGRKLGVKAKEILGDNSAWVDNLIAATVEFSERQKTPCILFHARSLETIFKWYPFLRRYTYNTRNPNIPIYEYFTDRIKSMGAAFYEKSVGWKFGFKPIEDRFSSYSRTGLSKPTQVDDESLYMLLKL